MVVDVVSHCKKKKERRKDNSAKLLCGLLLMKRKLPSNASFQSTNSLDNTLLDKFFPQISFYILIFIVLV